MAIQAYQPPPKNQAADLAKLAAIGAAVYTGGAAAAGGATAGATASAAGSAALQGAGAGSVIGSLTQRPQAGAIESQGMARRLQTVQVDPVRAISEAQAAMQGLPPDQFPEVRKAFDQALTLAQRNQQLGRGY